MEHLFGLNFLYFKKLKIFFKTFKKSILKFFRKVEKNILKNNLKIISKNEKNV